MTVHPNPNLPGGRVQAPAGSNSTAALIAAGYLAVAFVLASALVATAAPEWAHLAAAILLTASLLDTGFRSRWVRT